MSDGPGLAVSRLTKHAFELPEALSPGSLFGCRVAIAALPEGGEPLYEAFLASGRQVYSLAAPRGSQPFHGWRGKEGVCIPQPAAPGAAHALPQLAHRAEVQDLRLVDTGGGGAVLATADCYGRATLAHLRRAGGAGDALEPGEAQQCQPADLLVEAGWAGVAVAPGQPSQAAVARHFAKDVTLFDGGIALRTIHTTYPPAAVSLLSSCLAEAPGGGPLVAVAEGPQVSLWDVRGAGRGARVARLTTNSPHHGALYALAVADDGGAPLLAAAGEDRAVFVWDARKWVTLDRWGNCSKYELTALHFSSANPSSCYAGGLDYEVVCGEWGGSLRGRQGGGTRTGSGAAHAPSAGESGGGAQHGTATSHGTRAVSFRGDSRWAGLAKACGQDVLAGVTQSCQLYVAELKPV